MSQTQILEDWRVKIKERTDKIKARIEEWKEKREAGASRTLRPQALAKQIREKGLVETLRARRGASRASGRGGAGASVGQKEYKKGLALEASAGQLKIQKGRVAIEA